MILFKKVYPAVTPTPFTRATKETIWEYLKTGKDASQIFKEHNVPTADTELVVKEIERLEAEVFSKIKGTWKLTDAILDGEGNEVTPATYFVVTTRAALTDSMTFNYVLKVPFMDSLITYYPTYDEGRTWLQFKTSVENNG